MPGHSKFANIKHKKECNDATEDKIFTVIGRKTTAAVKEGGADSANSSKLRDVIVKAKADNTPNDTIDRSIKKTAGDANSVNYETSIYKGYGPNDVVIIVDILTNNKNRAIANTGDTFTKDGGNVGTPGSVSYMLDKKGRTIIDREKCSMDPDKLMMPTLDAGAEDFSEEEDSYEVVTASENFSVVREASEAQSIPMMQADVTMTPQAWMKLTDEDDIKRLNRTSDLLGEDDDVQAVYHNWGK